MPGVIRDEHSIGHPSFLKGFTGRKFVKSAVLLASSVGKVTGNEVQSVTITGTPTGGNFTLTFRGATTGNIAYNATAGTVESDLEGLSTIGAGNVSVTGSAGGPYQVEFVDDRGGEALPLISALDALTGGTSPGVTVARVTKGSSYESGRRIIRAGTLVTKVPGNPTKYRRFTDEAGEELEGVMGRDIDLLSDGPEGDVDIPVYQDSCVFDSTKILDYATYKTQIEAAYCFRNSKFDPR